MIIYYDSSGEHRIAWGSYEPQFVQEICTGVLTEDQVQAVVLGHEKKQHDRHKQENAILSCLLSNEIGSQFLVKED